MNLSFAGCGFLGIYHVGVASCFREYAPHVLVDKISGASAGALAACALICGVPLGASTSDVLRIVVKARSRALGPFHPGFELTKYLLDGLKKMLPEDAHIRCSGRLFISCTRVPDGKNVLLSQFDSKEDLIQALLCSTFIPFYSGIIPMKFHGVGYMDGGISNNLPILDEHTVTISPFSGESDICPEDKFAHFMQINVANTNIAMSPSNLYRLPRILFPPPPDMLSNMCQQGFDDALRFLQRNNMISCTRCLAVQSSFVVSEVSKETEEVTPVTTPIVEEPEVLMEDHEYDGCEECNRKRQLALYNGLPEAVSIAIQEAVDDLNKGVINWLFRRRPMKLLSLLTIPYVLPIDITIIALSKLWDMVPKLRNELQGSFWNLVKFTRAFLSKFDKSRHLYSAKFSCQLAITEYNYTIEEESVTCNPKTPVPSRKTSRVSSPIPMLTVDQRSYSLEEIPPNSMRVQRKSYAGTSNVPNFQPRRVSVVERPDKKSRTERIISSMNFGFTMDLSQHNKKKRKMAVTNMEQVKDKRHSFMEAFKSLDNDVSEVDMIRIANKALDMEREYLHRSQPDLLSENNAFDTFEHILDVTSKHDALMAYYYLDEYNRVQVTEIFNVTDADTSAVLAPEERENNDNLQWDSDWRSKDLTLTEDSDFVVHSKRQELCTPRKTTGLDFGRKTFTNEQEYDSSDELIFDSVDCDDLEGLESFGNDFSVDLEKQMNLTGGRKGSFLIADED